MNVLVVDDHQMIRLGLSNMLTRVLGVETIDTVTNGKEALDRLADQRYEFVFMDIKMPVMDGIVATKHIKEKYPSVNVIAMSIYDDHRHIKDMFESGAKGYLLKDTNHEEIEKAIANISSGKLYAAPQASDALLNDLSPDRQSTEPDFTEREKQVLLFLTQGLTSKKIASRLHLSKKSIDLCRSQLLEKTNCKSSTELISYAIKYRLIAL